MILDETGECQSDEENELDLKAFDCYSWQVIEDLRNNTKDLSDEDFEAAIEEHFVTLNSNGVQVDLVPGGQSKRVTKQNLNEYIKAIVNTRLQESQRQIKAIKEGIEFVIPLQILKVFTWKQVEIRATGNKSISIDKLKSITKYKVSPYFFHA